jgi:hypothetical protein
VYLVNASLFFANQINIAYFKVWELYSLPIDFQLFVAVNFLLLLLFIYGLIEVKDGTKAGIYFSLGLALIGVTPLFITYYFLLMKNIGVHPYSFFVMVQALAFGASFTHATMVALIARKRKMTQSQISIVNQKS